MKKKACDEEPGMTREDSQKEHYLGKDLKGEEGQLWKVRGECWEDPRQRETDLWQEELGVLTDLKEIHCTGI